MNRLHTYFITIFPSYRSWHEHQPFSTIAHWVVLLAITLQIGGYALYTGGLLGLGTANETNATASAIEAGVHVPPQRAGVIAGQYLVVFADGEKDPSGLANQLATEIGASVLYIYTSVLKGAALEHVPESAVNGLAHNPHVAFIEQDQLVNVSGTQNTSSAAGIGTKWGLDRIDQRTLPLNSTYTWNSDGSGVNLYVIDTGVVSTNFDISGRASGAFTAVNDGNGTNDCNSHGTAVSAIAGGSTYGVAKNVTIYGVRVLDCTGSGTGSQVLAGLDWVSKNAKKPAVINMSIGGSVFSTENTAIENLYAAGILTVVAASNNSANACSYSPASAPDALTVGATTGSDGFASYSNYGSCVDLLAPGSAIPAPYIKNGATAVANWTGTSMAAPAVAGLAVQYLSLHPSASPSEVTQAILKSATQNAISLVPAGTVNKLAFSGDPATVQASSTPVADTSAPTAPSALGGTPVSATQVNLTWGASKDNLAVAGYKVMRDGTQIASVTGTAYSDTSAKAATTYSYTVRAFDAAGTDSIDSIAVSISTPSAPVPALSLSGISVSGVTATTAVVKWTTNVATTGTVQYRITNSLTSLGVTDSTNTTSHVVALSALAKKTNYTVTVTATDSTTGETITANSTFTTKPH